MTSYDTVRSAVLQSGSDTRVEVNQRALIDKILARYASQGAVYRELLQNSNDAEATNAEIYFTTAASPSSSTRNVTQVVYRNNGHPFRPSDWSRLRNIAEGNPDVSKVGAFGVGAYTMFSICEEPLVISGKTALAFSWRGDALWARSAPVKEPDAVWTTFVLPSRDLYPLPDLVSFAQFLCASLTFTTSLNCIRLYIDDAEVLAISKTTVEQPTIVTPPRASSWFSNDGMLTTSPHKIFTLGRTDGTITQTVVEISVTLHSHTHAIRARYLSAQADVRVPADMHKRILRVTKKAVPPHVYVHIFVDAAARAPAPNGNLAAEVTGGFSPPRGAGRVFIGFRTSQTTGLAAHLAAPLVPTVEREAIDFQDAALEKYNSDLLFVAGIVMRLTFENAMNLVADAWLKATPQRQALLEKLEREAAEKVERKQIRHDTKDVEMENASSSESGDGNGGSNQKNRGGDGLFSFVRFMTSGVRRFAEVITSIDTYSSGEEDLFNPPDLLPLSSEERDAIMLMHAFSPEYSTPDQTVGALIAKGFSSCMPKLSPPVLTKSGVVRASDARLPYRGIEYFIKSNVIRKIVVDNAETFVKHVAVCRPLSVKDLVEAMAQCPLSEEDFVRFLKWWVKFSRAEPAEAGRVRQALRTVVSFHPKEEEVEGDGQTNHRIVKLADILYFRTDELSSSSVPMPPSVLSHHLQEEITLRVLQESALSSWLQPIPRATWAGFIAGHSCMTNGRVEDEEVRLEVLVLLSKEHARHHGPNRDVFEKWLFGAFGQLRCIPFESPVPVSFATEFPTDLYLPNAEIDIFQGLGSFRRVSPKLEKAGVSKEFLIALGVRKAISIDFLFTQLDNLKWNNDPQPLIRYLRTATLTDSDLEKLRHSQYLPAAGDDSRTFSPSELYLPSDELSIFPFLKILQWPSSSPLHSQSQDAIFLKRLGCGEHPPLSRVINFLVNDVKDSDVRMQCLEFIAKRLGRGGVYEGDYSMFRDSKFIPAVRKHPLADGDEQMELHSPSTCFRNADAKCMGFAVLNPNLDTRSGIMLGERLRCVQKPSPDQLVVQLLHIVNVATSRTQPPNTPSETLVARIANVFRSVFRYLSTRSNEMSVQHFDQLRMQKIIPYQEGKSLIWFKPSEVYFKNESNGVDGRLFKVVDFDAFLAAVGVSSEPTTTDLLKLIMASPQQVLRNVGGDKEYLSLLRRIAAVYPLAKVTAEMKECPFLLAYRMSENEEPEFPDEVQADSVDGTETSKYSLAKASDICVIDNMYFVRVFSVLTAPQESDLEHFYESLGTVLISQRVQTRFMMPRNQLQNTAVTRQFSARLKERQPLLVSSKVTSRQLRPNAQKLLAPDNVTVSQTGSIEVEYKFQSVVKKQNVTCSAIKLKDSTCQVFITERFDWFDVGSAIGRLILKRCQVEDAYFIGSILKEPVSQLRSLGFPVDRILRSAPESDKLRAERDLPSSVTETDRIPTVNNVSPVQNENSGDSGFEQILKQMFPGLSSTHAKDLLGATPSLETLRLAATSLSEGNYPLEKGGDTSNTPGNGTSVNETDTRDHPPDAKDESKKLPHGKRDRGSSWWGKPFRSSKSRERDISEDGSSAGDGKSHMGNGFGLGIPGGKMILGGSQGQEVTPAHDAASNAKIMNSLQRAARATRAVAPEGVKGAVEMPEPVAKPALDIAPACSGNEVHNLQPFHGQTPSGLTSHGMRVFTSGTRSSDTFLRQQWNAVERLAVVLQTLCGVFNVKRDAVAIFHEAVGTTIAFNHSGTLYFNVRYDMLHDETANRYAFWFTTMAHELAHQMRADHSREHAFFTESYVTMYMPKLLSELPHIFQKTQR